SQCASGNISAIASKICLICFRVIPISSPLCFISQKKPPCAFTRRFQLRRLVYHFRIIFFPSLKSYHKAHIHSNGRYLSTKRHSTTGTLDANTHTNGNRSGIRQTSCCV